MDKNCIGCVHYDRDEGEYPCEDCERNNYCKSPYFDYYMSDRRDDLDET